MHNGKGRIVEMLLEDELHLARIACPASLIPAPGQYLLASDASDSPLPVPLFHTESASESFTALLSASASWNPGQELFLRGPLGRGFDLPTSARKIALIAADVPLGVLRGLIQPSLKQGAAVVLVSDFASERLSDEVEVQPFSAWPEIMVWADYVALEVARENLIGVKERLGMSKQVSAGLEAEILIRTPVPCGGIAECGVCAVSLKSGRGLACKDGPVFDWSELGF
jgi:dihydroorotate dehydrogenase electron transfer subunit